MSTSKKLHEANRWWQTARDDLNAARALEQAGLFAHACFQCQQCAEKAIKALYYFIEADPWGHSIQKLVEEFPQPSWLKPREQWLRYAAFLDKFYIPTRYPNGLPDLTPDQVYNSDDAVQAFERANFFLEETHKLIMGL